MKTHFYLACFILISLRMHAQTTVRPWLLTGNKGTNPAINFLGTKDAQPLVFRVNNQSSGFIELDFSKANTSFGYQALKANTSVNNTAFGYNTLTANTNGQYNVAVGSFNLLANTTGLGNTAVGAVSLVSNTTGSFNTAVGENALIGNTTGEANTGVGNQTLSQNKIGHDNVALGSLALYFNTADYNTALGSNSLYDNTTGHDNTAAGLYSLYRSTSGNNNTALGSGAMFNNLDGSNNTAVGNSALYLPLHGNNCTALGFNANVAFENLTNATVIGYNAVVDASNKVRIGNTSVTSIGGQVGWTNFSDERVKKDIKENVPGLKFINALRAVTYHYNITKENELMGRKDTAQSKGKYDIEKIQFTGFLAQEVDAAAKSVNYDFSGVDKSGRIWGLRYAEFVVPIIKALQELNDSLKQVTSYQQQELKTLRSRLDKIEAALSLKGNTDASNSLKLSSAGRLEQNMPNPFRSTTTIGYSVPKKFSSAYINIYSSSGTLMKSIQLRNSDIGSITLTKGEFAAGSYQYSLIVNGRIIDTKQMILAK